VGDASDNYPGVNGIGPKTASGLLSKYQTLEGVYENLIELSPQIQEKLANDAEQAALAKKLATIVLDAPVKFNEKDAETNKIDNAALKKVFEELNFKSLLGKVSKESIVKVKPEVKKKTNEKQMNLL
jgi:DNA polymerase-1